MDNILEKTLLYDFYGELLTEHQRKVFEDAVFNDLSLSEVAEDAGISRQGVHDLLKRVDKLLQEYENKLHLVEKFRSIREEVESIEALTKDFDETKDSKIIKEIRNKAQKIMTEI